MDKISLLFVEGVVPGNIYTPPTEGIGNYGEQIREKTKLLSLDEREFEFPGRRVL